MRVRVWVVWGGKGGGRGRRKGRGMGLAGWLAGQTSGPGSQYSAASSSSIVSQELLGGRGPWESLSVGCEVKWIKDTAVIVLWRKLGSDLVLVRAL